MRKAEMPNSYDQLIQEHYDDEAREHSLEPSSTMPDVTVRQLETRLVERFVGLAIGSLAPNSRPLAVCDVGCGNGFTLEVLRERYPTMDYQGFEFTPSLRELAQSRFTQATNVSISPGDIRRLDCDSAQFDVTLCQRVLINLLDADDQRAALSELARVTRPGGYLLSIEAFVGPLANLNAARSEFDLPPLEQAYHNRYLPDDFFSAEPSLTPVNGPMVRADLPVDFLPSNFLSSHYFASRVLHPLALGPHRPFIRNSHFVLFLTRALNPAIGDYAPIKAHSFQRVAS